MGVLRVKTEDGFVAVGGVGESVEIDATLTQPGKAADAKAVGDALAELEAQIPEGGGSADLTGYATEEWVKAGYQPKGDYLTEVPAGYAKSEDIPTKPSDIGAQPAGNYATKGEIPATLPNPCKLTFSGAATAEYDGSEAVEVVIPQGGGGAAEAVIQKIGLIEITEETAGASSVAFTSANYPLLAQCKRFWLEIHFNDWQNPEGSLTLTLNTKKIWFSESVKGKVLVCAEFEIRNGVLSYGCTVTDHSGNVCNVDIEKSSFFYPQDYVQALPYCHFGTQPVTSFTIGFETLTTRAGTKIALWGA